MVARMPALFPNRSATQKIVRRNSNGSKEGNATLILNRTGMSANVTATQAAIPNHAQIRFAEKHRRSPLVAALVIPSTSL